VEKYGKFRLNKYCNHPKEAYFVSNIVMSGSLPALQEHAKAATKIKAAPVTETGPYYNFTFIEPG
jgi:hypothetical protein